MPNETIATFCTVRPVRKADGRHELMGGTAYDQATVRKWCRRFAPFVGIGVDLKCVQAADFTSSLKVPAASAGWHGVPKTAIPPLRHSKRG